MTIRSLSAAIAMMLVLAACGARNEEHAKDAHGHAGAGHAEEGHAEEGHAEEEGQAAGEAKKGAHGGRLLEADGFAVELAIAETGRPPTYQAWLYRDGKPLPGAAFVQIVVQISRLVERSRK